jgi:protein-tyrosine phosphatase
VSAKTPNPKKTTGVLFVCLGNICRSPMAKFIFADMVAKRGLSDRFVIDSAGLGHWHVGGPADHRSIAVARRHGLDARHIARQIKPEDFTRFDLILGMDQANIDALLQRGAPEDRTALLRRYDAQALQMGELEVPDPYHDELPAFEEMYAMLVRACEGLLMELE